jgi:hypothetical protein
MRKLHFYRVLTVLLTSLAGCSGDTLRVESIQLGRSLNADSTVAVHTTTFKPNDTVYLSALTSGVGKGTIGVRWTYEGRVLGEPTKQVSSRDSGNVEFHLENAVGFPPGEYTVEVSFNGQPVEKRTFRVEKS